MSRHNSLAQQLGSYFHQRLTQQRNATPATVAAYRDALRLLVLFTSERTGKKPCALAIEDLDRDMILAYLEHLERARGNGVHTRNARLTAIRSFFHHVAATDPASIGIAHRVLAIPSKRADVPTTQYLSKAELDALIEAPSSSSWRGRRDRALLLFLARTGARVSEALGVDRTRPVVTRSSPASLTSWKRSKGTCRAPGSRSRRSNQRAASRAGRRSTRTSTAVHRCSRTAPYEIRRYTHRASSCSHCIQTLLRTRAKTDLAPSFSTFSRDDVITVRR